ncbi:ATP-dependent helicase [Actinocorallia aurantiaca]|uniref:DNA 3'-5' helicase n=1 Tax=Actinocorallia aurantiaca TaxID=46204 RepID=A0ABN3UJ31_9ACTN
MIPPLDPAHSPRENLLVIAPPGCGKTELLARRAAHLLPVLEPHQRILALTFSNRAKANLAERLLTGLGPQRFRRIKVTNFHGHAAELIRAHGPTIGLDPHCPLANKSTLSQAIEPYISGLPFAAAAQSKRQIELALAAAKSQPHDDDEVLKVLAEIGNQAALEIELERRQQGVLHYDDLLRHAQRLLGIKKIAYLYQQHFSAILVDEFQDLSPQQLQIALASTARHRTFVGDPLQGIYSWAGARPAEVEAHLLEICGEPHYLNTSYRSSPAVLAVVNRASSLLGGQPLQAADPAAWPSGGQALYATFDTGLQEAQWILDEATRLLEADPSTTIGVIIRAAWRRRPIDEVFANAKIPTQRWDLPIEDDLIVQHLLDAIQRLPRQADMATITQTVLESIDPTDVDTREQALHALHEFSTLVKHDGTPRAAAAQLRPPATERAISPGVHILNAHTGKGQQFDWVFIPGIEGFHIPSGQAKTPAERQEELRVALVMLSRARHGLAATRALTLIANSGNPYSTKPSQWWAAITSACHPA